MSKADVLIVEDSPTQAQRLRVLLEGAGYRVQSAGDGEAALRALTHEIPDLLITDVVMPRVDGYELCARIKADPHLRDLPVILLTSLGQPADIIRGLQSGADNFIRKPYEERYLLSRVSNIITSRDLRRSSTVHVGIEVDLGGERQFINADRQQILDFLLSTYEEIAEINAVLDRRSRELEARNAELRSAMSRLEAERQRSETLLSINRAVLDATTDGIALLDEAGRSLLANVELRRLSGSVPGISPRAPLAENVRAVLPQVADADALRAFVEEMTADDDRRGDLLVELPDARLAFRVSTGPVRATDGAWLGRLLVLRDVTHEREVERLKSELVATVSHELRTPLASVLGFAELLTMGDVDDERRAEFVETIVQEARQLSRLVDDFLDLHRIEHGHFSVTLRELDLREVIRRQVETFAGQSPAHELALQLSDQPLIVMGDEARLIQVLANLLSNAIKYSPSGGPVDVGATLREGTVEVAVRDRGMGIPEDQQHQIFTKFFRVDSSETRSIGGTGVGLAVCREIVEAHGGQIGFDSAPGVGSTFWIRLPEVRTASTTTGRTGDPSAHAERRPS